mmetsp:Transcript_15474/g.13221  ORF Transcript_15474/g.13221 Transcript_15474/m.13221 type:complete len:98 (+) Transcript_15474:1308-1601(+)
MNYYNQPYYGPQMNQFGFPMPPHMMAMYGFNPRRRGGKKKRQAQFSKNQFSQEYDSKNDFYSNSSSTNTKNSSSPDHSHDSYSSNNSGDRKNKRIPF